MGKQTIMIQMEDIGFSYPNGQTVLSNINFKLYQGQKMGLIGHNGSGKSTFLHIIMGLVQASSGTLRLFDTVISTEAEFQEARKRIGLVFQNSDDQLFSPTVLEDICFGLLNQGKSPEVARQKAENLLETLDLKGFENRITYKLSGGEKRLVALATVLVMEPEILLLDEPFTGLDESIRERIFDILNYLNISYIIVSHEFDSLAQTTTDICTMDDGMITYNGKSDILHSHFHKHPGGKAHHHHQ